MYNNKVLQANYFSIYLLRYSYKKKLHRTLNKWLVCNTL